MMRQEISQVFLTIHDGLLLQKECRLYASKCNFRYKLCLITHFSATNYNPNSLAIKCSPTAGTQLVSGTQMVL